jgi:feruloyl esterase
VTALAGKAIIERYYHAPPKKSYFIGASTGGRQALQEAQRFPWDFDGIIAIAAPTDLSILYTTFAWGWRVTHAEDGTPLLSDAELKLLTDSAVAKCDFDDGVKDGIIGDPVHCAFDPSALLCKASQTSGCLTSVQVDAVRKVYAGPMTSRGTKLSFGGPVIGSEQGWGTQFDPEIITKYMTGAFRYLFFLPAAGPGWKLGDFDFDRDYRRLGIMESLYDSNNPNLRAFKAADGKLMILQGLNDTVVLPESTVDYYEMVERTMGGRTETQSFARLFLVPGADHFLGGTGAGVLDSLGALEAWVERDQAPDRLIAAHLKDNQSIFPLDFSDFSLDTRHIQFTRPVFPYPLRAKYRGRGDPSEAASFVPIGR